MTQIAHHCCGKRKKGNSQLGKETKLPAETTRRAMEARKHPAKMTKLTVWCSTLMKLLKKVAELPIALARGEETLVTL